MKYMKKIVAAATSLILTLSLLLCSILPASAASSSTANILVGLLTGSTSSGGSINISQLISQGINNAVNEPGPFDGFVDNLTGFFTGTTNPEPENPEDDKEEIAVIDGAEAGNVAELFNLTVNELKKGAPSFTKTVNGGMSDNATSTLTNYASVIGGLFESLITEKDLAAAVIDGTNGKPTEVKIKYPAGNDVKNNISVSGTDFVSRLVADDISDYEMTIYKSGAYKIHIDLKDADGASSQSGLAHVFDTNDKANVTLNILGGQLNVGIVRVKHINNYVECEVNRRGEITSYTQHSSTTFMFQQQDGTYSTKIPILNLDFAESQISYDVTAEYTNIDFGLRKMGDANNDGKVNSTDARLVLRMSSGLENYTDEDKKYIDVDLDSKVTATDARLIIRASASLGTLPTTADALGMTEYITSEATKKQISDLLILMVAYQNAKDAKEQQALEDLYNDKYNGESTSETTTVQETTTGNMNSTGDIIDGVIGGIGSLIGSLIK